MTIFEELIYQELTESVWFYLDGNINDIHDQVTRMWLDVMISQGESYGWDKMVNELPNQAHFIVCQAEGRPA